MTLGRTPAGAIKTKTDGGLRAVECACCGGTYGFPCADCPPILAEFTFSVTGDQLTGLTEFQYPAIICPSDNCNLIPFPNISPRTCSDSYDAFKIGPLDGKLVISNLNRSFIQGCSWELGLYVQGIFEYPYDGGTDLCSVIWGDAKYTGKTAPQIFQEKQGEVYSKGLVANEMSYRFINDKNLDKQMSKFFLSAGDLASYVPAYSKNWKNVPGFTEEGGLAAGTTLNINENRAPKIVMHGNQMLYEIPITYKKDGVSTETTVTVKPKKGMNVRHDKLLKDLDWASGGGTATEAADKETNTMIKAMRFDNKFQNNNLSPQLIQSIDVAKGQSPVELFSAPFSNTTKLVVYKANTNGTDPSLNIAQVDKNSGKVLGYLNNPKTGKPFYTHADDPEAYVEVKNLIMQALGD